MASNTQHFVLTVRDAAVSGNVNGQFTRACPSRAVAVMVLGKYVRTNWAARQGVNPMPAKTSEAIRAYFPAGDLADLALSGEGPAFSVVQMPFVDEQRAANMPPRTVTKAAPKAPAGKQAARSSGKPTGRTAAPHKTQAAAPAATTGG